MNPLFFVGLTLSACAVVHYSVMFLEPAKASLGKATALHFAVLIGANAMHWADINPQPILQWFVFIVLAALCVRSLFKLNSLNSLTVGACYVAGSYVLAQAVPALLQFR